jgi:arylsulfatase A
MRTKLPIVSVLVLLVSISAAAALAAPPNYVVIFCDDLGYGDLGCYGSTKNRTPHIDGLAKAGMRFSDFYVSSPVCTPSRSSLMTGSYARRVGMHEDFTGHWVLIPRSRRGLNPDETTLPEALKTVDYATVCIGKWHLGDQSEHLPTRHGFDAYFGIPYSNDMASARRGDPPLPLVRDEAVIEAPAKQSTLTKRYTKEAIAFIEKNQKKPFLLYLPHTFPHLPLFASPDFHGKSANGRYGDSVEEIDWSTGEILKCLDRLKLRENTLVIFTSDNGSNGRNGGSNRPLSGNKGTTMEGGMRVPMIARWPDKIPAGTVCSELASTMDFLPTFCALSGAKQPTAKIDGFDISPLLFGKEGAKSPYEAFYYYRRRQLQAIRWGHWKWHLPLEQRYQNWDRIKGNGRPVKGRLFNLAKDLQEKTNVATGHPEVMATMKKLAAAAMADLGNEAKGGTGQRDALTLRSSKPMLLK